MRKFTTFKQILFLVCSMLLFPLLVLGNIRITPQPMQKTVAYSEGLPDELHYVNNMPSAKAPADFTPTVCTTGILNKGEEGSRRMSVIAYQLWNGGSRDLDGIIKFAVCDSNGNFLEIFGDTLSVNLGSGSYYLFGHTVEGTLPDTYTDGNYRLYMVAQQNGYNDWSFVTYYHIENNTVTSMGDECYINFWIRNNEVTYMNPDVEYYPQLEFISLEDLSNLSTRQVTASVGMVMNYAEETFSGHLALALADNEGNIISVLEEAPEAINGLDTYYYLIDPRYLVGTMPEDLADGMYRIYVVARQDGYAQWAKLTKYTLVDGYLADYGRESFLTYEVIDGMIYFREQVLAESITLNATSVTLFKGETTTLVATVLPDNATNKSVSWSSSNTNVATVDENGVVTALLKGTAKITAKANDDSGVSAQATITVKNVTATNIELNYSSYTLKKGETIQLEAIVSPENVENASVSWSSSSTAIASVTSSGLVTAKSVGSATITAKTKDGSNLTAKCDITVEPTLVETITLSSNMVELEVGGTYQLSATVLPETATNKNVTWTSSNENIMMVTSSGLVKGLAIGEATVTATAADGSGVSASATVHVISLPVNSITLNQTYVVLQVGEHFSLTATVSPANATNTNVLWSSSNDDVAMVTSSGNVVALAPGETVVTATAADGSGVSASATIVVSEILVSSITLNYTAFSLDKGQTIVLEATVEPDDAANKQLSWKSSDEDVVMVSSTGKVIWMGVGTAVVTATSTDGSNVSASCTFSCINGIVTIDMDNSSSVIIYTVDGKKVDSLQEGVNLVRKADGAIEKVIIKH